MNEIFSSASDENIERIYRVVTALLLWIIFFFYTVNNHFCHFFCY
jgi:hypothetical protein